MKRILLLVLAVLFISLVFPVSAYTTDVYLFHGQGCPHCEKAKLFLTALADENPEVVIHEHEIYYNEENNQLFERMAKSFNTRSSGVPCIFVDDKIFLGYASDETTGKAIKEKVLECVEKGCIDPSKKVPSSPEMSLGPSNEKEELSIPFFGREVNITEFALPLLTIFIGFIDGFNPCAFFVLCFLLSMLILAQSRKKILLIGITFVFFSGLIYFLFMSAWLNLFFLLGQLQLIIKIAAIIAFIVALVNIKDYFFYKKVISLTIPDWAKPKLFSKMRNLLQEGSLPAMMLGTIVLAIMANAYELLCTAGFPMVFTRILTLHNLSSWGYYSYLALYNLVYIIPLTAIVVFFAFTLGKRQLTEHEGRVLKLLSGIMMLGLAIILLINPALLNNILIAFGLIAGAIITTFLINSICKWRKKCEY